MEGGRVNHRWCMGVVDHSYGGLGGGREGGSGWQAYGTKPGGLGRVSELIMSARWSPLLHLISPLSSCAVLVGLSRDWSIFLGKP